MKDKIRITIPDEIINAIKLKKDDKFDIYAKDGEIIIKVSKISKFYGILKAEGVKEWPKPEEIKSIWE
jgi:bifunctional DNA-binding transcriptional regulator/antitoxin component of YhaV-PrlF toxin-antitoxin module